MSDDVWRRRGHDDAEDEFGGPLFGDDLGRAGGDAPRRSRRGADGGGGALSFGDHDAEPLPHWTAPPTGEIPDVLVTDQHAVHHEDVDVWSTFSDQGPAWEEEPTNPQYDSGGQRRVPSFDDLEQAGALDDLSPRFEEAAPEPPRRGRFTEPSRGLFDDDAPATFGEVGEVGDERDLEPRPRRSPDRIQIGTDPTDGHMGGPPVARGPRPRPRPGEPMHPGRPPRPGVRPTAPRPVGGTKGRDMPTAIGVGVAIAVVFLIAVRTKPWVVGMIVVLVLALAAVEYFDRVREKGYEPAIVPGLAACIAAPLAVYFYGGFALPLVAVLAFGACAITFIGARGLESNPLPNMAITLLGVFWIGIMGSFGAAIVALSNLGGGNPIGTDTLTLVAVAVVANDVGALFVGSAVGRTPLRAWISPNKSIEGFIGGALATLGAMLIIGVMDKSDTWNSTGDLLLLGLVVAFVAPIGDLTESMFKRNLDVKDFGSIIKGHGGALDRFDAFLFAMPAAYYLLIYLKPWVS
jgi:phosphatidate cytidylyltransferase